MSAEEMESKRDERRAGRGDTQRLEAFSDGVFAVAITLLVLNLRVPTPKELAGQALLTNLREQWPSYLAYAISFSFILIMWINHHELFKLIRRCDHILLILNGSLLLFVTLVPFSTALLATYIASGQPGQSTLANQRTAAAIYSGMYVLVSICFNGLWRYASGGRRLLDERVHDRHIRSFSNAYLLGPLMYLAALLLAFASPLASLVLNVALAIFWAVFPLLQRSFVRPENPVTAAMSPENEPAGW